MATPARACEFMRKEDLADLDEVVLRVARVQLTISIV